jgi:hypothetical protein
MGQNNLDDPFPALTNEVRLASGLSAICGALVAFQEALEGFFL